MDIADGNLLSRGREGAYELSGLFGGEMRITEVSDLMGTDGLIGPE